MFINSGVNLTTADNDSYKPYELNGAKNRGTASYVDYNDENGVSSEVGCGD